VVWARARDTALDFYERHGFVRRGMGYVDLSTQIPHHDIVRER
jgi:predicted GNAT family N-acyltransferase